MDWSSLLHQLAIPVVYYKLKVQFIIYPLIIDLMQVKRSKIVSPDAHPFPFLMATSLLL